MKVHSDSHLFVVPLRNTKLERKQKSSLNTQQCLVVITQLQSELDVVLPQREAHHSDLHCTSAVLTHLFVRGLLHVFQMLHLTENPPICLLLHLSEAQ